jgi:CRP-like cAMP-binding protein
MKLGSPRHTAPEEGGIVNKEQVVSVLRKCEVFSRLSERELRSIAAMAAMESFHAGETIYTQGSIGRKLYVLAEGQVVLERTMNIGGEREATVPVFIQRENPSRRLMGAWSSLVGEEHVQMCTARCYKPTTVITLLTEELGELLSEHPGTRVGILEKLVLLLRDRIASSYQEMEAV